MRIILDTGTLFQPATIQRAFADGRPVVVPTLVVAERARQMDRDSRDGERLTRSLEAAGASFESFGRSEAAHLPPGAHDDALWRRHARDALIAAHIGPHDELWTTNPRDFEALGVPAARLRGW